jgi:DNA polymerase-3 subunit chi
VTQIDFYIVENRDPDARLTLACRIAEKALQHAQRTYVNTASDDESSRLDAMLWTFSQGSFVPHRIVEPGDAGQSREPVLIGNGELPADLDFDLVINLAEDVPAHYDRYRRVAEVVDGDEQRRKRGRQRFRFYRDQGGNPDTHKL